MNPERTTRNSDAEEIKRLAVAPSSAAPGSAPAAEPTRRFADDLELLASLPTTHDHAYEYRRADGTLIGLVIQWEQPDGSKERQARRNDDGAWSFGRIPEPVPLYRLPEFSIEEGPVFVVEDEKCSDALVGRGKLATTWPGGAGHVQVDWSPLAGRELLLIPGSNGAVMDRVASAVSRISPNTTIKVLPLTTLPDGVLMPAGSDVADWLEAGGDIETLHEIAASVTRFDHEPWRTSGAEPITTTAAIEVDQPEPPLPRQPFPLDALPPTLERFCCETAEVIQVDSSMVALPALIEAAAAIGATREIAISDDWVEPCILWGVTVAPTGAGKTPAAAKALAPIRRHDSQQQAENDAALDEHSAELEASEGNAGTHQPSRRPAMIRSVVSDITPEALAEVLGDNPRGVLVERDELSGMLGSMDRYNRGAGSAARGNYLSMWSADRMTVNRKTGERKAITVDRPHVSIYGGIQPELLHNVIDDLDVAAGLPARFLYSLPPIKPRHLSRARISDKAKIQFHALIDRLLELSAGDSDEGVRPWRVRLSEGAWEVFREFHDRVERTRVELQGPVVGSVAKMNGQVARLALVLHVIRLVTGELETDQAMVCSADTMRDAVRLADWFLNEARRVFALRSETAEHAADRKFIEWIEKNGGAVTVRGVIAGMRRFRKSRADVVEVELNRLRDAGHGYWRTVDTKGRPRREFVLGKAADCVNVNGRSQAPEGTDIC